MPYSTKLCLLVLDTVYIHNAYIHNMYIYTHTHIHIYMYILQNYTNSHPIVLIFQVPRFVPSYRQLLNFSCFLFIETLYKRIEYKYTLYLYIFHFSPLVMRYKSKQILCILNVNLVLPSTRINM